jgi:hypothetical protein
VPLISLAFDYRKRYGLTMRKRSSTSHDFMTNARRVVEQAIGEHMDGTPLEPAPVKNPHAVALGRLGGAIGGPARAAAMSPRKRSQIAKRAAMARWGNR